jgi:tetratricopeptide (TPR) repeat protein
MSEETREAASTRELIDLAHRDPGKTLELGAAILKRPDNDPRSLALAHRAMAVASRASDSTLNSLQHARDSLAAAEKSDDETLIVESMMTLGGSLAFAGDNFAALEILEDAKNRSSGHLAAEVRFQIGTVHARIGETALARQLFSEALPVFVEAKDDQSVAMTLHNRGMINLKAGAIDEALADFQRAREIEERLGMQSALAAVEHNIGVATAYAGDLPAALRMLDESEAMHLEFAASPAEVQVSRVEVLLTAGLFHEAYDLAKKVATELEAMGLAEDQAEAVLAGAVAARLYGDTDGAIELARTAMEMFAAQDRDAWMYNAEQVELAALLDAGSVALTDVGRARELAESLEKAEYLDAAFNARLTAGLIAIQTGQPHEAIRALREVARQSGGPLQRRLMATLASALAHELEGDVARAERQARAGMDMLDDYQAVLGAIDVRAGLENHAVELAQVGLRLAVESGEPMRVLDWIERTRARSLQHRPARIPPDSPVATDLADLRRVESMLRGASRADAAGLDRRRRQLESSIREKSRYSKLKETSELVLETQDIVTRLGNRTLIELGAVGDQVWMVIVNDNVATVRAVGSLADVRREIGWHRFSMRRLALGQPDRDQATKALERIDQWIFDGMEIVTDDVVMVPLPSMFAFSWSALPSLADHSLTVSPSARLWAARSLGQIERLSFSAITGPDLEHAEEEARLVSAVYPGARDVSHPSSVAEALNALGNSEIAHVASHARFARQSPLFSSLQLKDGDLYVYDLQQLETPPKMVVLSACDSGFSESHPGEEMLGLTSALLAIGSQTVIASIGLVPDSEATKALMVSFHERLIAGDTPSGALRAARTSVLDLPGGQVAADSFICVGVG